MWKCLLTRGSGWVGEPQILLGLQTVQEARWTPEIVPQWLAPCPVGPGHVLLAWPGRGPSACTGVVRVVPSDPGAWLPYQEANPHAWGRGSGSPARGCKGPAWAGAPRRLPPPGRPVSAPAAPTAPRASVWRRKQPICFHSESLKIPFWRNEKRKARFPRPARWVPARARRRAGGAGRCPVVPPTPAPWAPAPGPRLGVRGQRPGRAHLHEAHTRGPSAKAQLNAWGRGRGRPKLAFPRPSGEERARPDKGRRARGEASVPPH